MPVSLSIRNSSQDIHCIIKISAVNIIIVFFKTNAKREGSQVLSAPPPVNRVLAHPPPPGAAGGGGGGDVLDPRPPA